MAAQDFLICFCWVSVTVNDNEEEDVLAIRFLNINIIYNMIINVILSSIMSIHTCNTQLSYKQIIALRVW